MQCSYFNTTPDRTEHREISVPTLTIYSKHDSIKITTEFFFKKNNFHFMSHQLRGTCVCTATHGTCRHGDSSAPKEVPSWLCLPTQHQISFLVLRRNSIYQLDLPSKVIQITLICKALAIDRQSGSPRRSYSDY